MESHGAIRRRAADQGIQSTTEWSLSLLCQDKVSVKLAYMFRQRRKRRQTRLLVQTDAANNAQLVGSYHSRPVNPLGPLHTSFATANQGGTAGDHRESYASL